MLKHRLITTGLGSIAAALTIAACGAGDPTTGAKAGGSENRGLPQGSEPVKLDPADFTTEIDNPYWPMRPGGRAALQSYTPGS